MKILYLTQFLEPEPTLKGLGFARALGDRGHEVEVLTGFPNYPTGQLYPGYKQSLCHVEEISGVRVLRTVLYPSHDRVKTHRIANYSSWALSSAVMGSLRARRPDVIYAYHPPLTTGFAAAALARRFGVPLVYDIQDLWPDTLSATGFFSAGSRSLQLVGVGCKWVYNRAEGIVVLSPGFKDRLVSVGVEPEKIRVIYNWCNEDQLCGDEGAHEFEQEVGPADGLRIVFAGNMGAAQGLSAVLDAAKILEKRQARAQFVFVGGGVDRQELMEKARDMQLSNVAFAERRPIAQMPGVFAASDVLLVHLKDDPLFRMTIPSKLQAYLFAGRPIIAGVRGDAAALLERAGAGICCEPENPESIADAVLSLCEKSKEELRRMGASGRRFYDDQLSLSAGVKATEEVLIEAI